MTLVSQAPVVTSATIEVISPDGMRSCAEIATSPFLIGRGEAGNHLPLSDKRISRQCASIVSQDDKYFLEDRGHRLGVFVNGEKIGRRCLEEGDVISLGLEDSYKLVFHCSPSGVASLQSLLTRISNVDDTDARSGGLSKLNLLLEVTRLMHSRATAGCGVGVDAGSRDRHHQRRSRITAGGGFYGATASTAGSAQRFDKF